jgi:hypothetical protein
MDKYQVLILRLFRNGVLQSEESDWNESTINVYVRNRKMANDTFRSMCKESCINLFKVLFLKFVFRDYVTAFQIACLPVYTQIR